MKPVTDFIHQRRPDECWPWTGAMKGNGYGSFNIRKPDGGYTTTTAHRASYEHFVGPIPDGLTIDHLCRNKVCVNPAHLEPVTQAENNRRRPQYNSLKTHCRRGHPYSAENTNRSNGRRYCRTCQKINMQAHAKRRAS